jgi:hypothetical protein
VNLARVVLVLLGIGAAATAAILLNLLLLGTAAAQNDPVGRLTPRANLPAAPQWTIRPPHGPVEHDGSDD